MASGFLRCYVAVMATFLSNIALPIALAAVTIVLLLGLFNMMRGGSPNRSQRLMQLRVLFMARYPARALTCGAVVDAAPASAPVVTTPDPAAPKRAYLKGLR